MIPIGEGNRSPVFPIGVYLLIALNLYVFCALELQAPNLDAFVNSFAAIPYDITRNVTLAPPSPPSPYFTLITSQFVHGGWLHLAANMLFLFVFGPEIEYLMGTLGFLAFYLACGAIAALAQVSLAPGSHVPSIGASGAIAGVLAAYLFSFPKASVRTVVPIGCFPLLLRLPAVLVIGLWIATQLLAGYGQLVHHKTSDGGGIAYFAHIGGFAAGAVLVRFFARRRPVRRRRAA